MAWYAWKGTRMNDCRHPPTARAVPRNTAASLYVSWYIATIWTVLMNIADATPDLPGRLGVAVQMLAHARKVGGGRTDLTPTRLTALAIMSSAGPMRMGGLASRLGVQVSTMSRIVDVMVASGWAERMPDEADHRACVIGITPAGAAVIDSVRQDNASRLADCVARLAPEDLNVLQAALPVLETLAQQVACRTRGAAPALS